MTNLPSASPIDVYRGPFTEREARRLLWRAGFGPRAGQSTAVARLGLDGAVQALTQPAGPARLVGPAPHDDKGRPLDPVNVWGHDHCWWLDRMVRSTHQLEERMTLVWHSWFATSIEASNAALMLGQNRMMRGHALGNFHDLLVDVTRDQELFTLGADRGAYSQKDVHQQARALTGWTNKWSQTGPSNFRFDPSLHDTGTKTIFGHRGNFDWRDTCRLCVNHPAHPSFMVTKLWGYFVGAPPPAGVLRALERTYVNSGFETRPLLEAILRHPLFYRGPRMVIPPAVYCAGLLRGIGRTIETDAWSWIGQQAGQRLFDPPNVAGWDYGHWLDTSRWSGRFTAVTYAMQGRVLNPNGHKYPAHETAAEAVQTALGYWSDPPLSSATHRNLLAFSRRAQRGITADWEQVTYRILRQNALRALIPTTPEWQTS
jgi:hypothetical protein